MASFLVSLTLTVPDVDTHEEAAYEFSQWARLAFSAGHPVVTVSRIPIGEHEGDPVEVRI